MGYEVKIKHMENKIERLKHRVEHKECPLCYGVGSIETPSKELDMKCWTCNGEGEIKI